jgi:acetyl-CoA C-acetyltransferase
MRDVAVIGTGWVPVGSYAELAEHELLAPVIKEALGEAGVEKRRLEGAVIIDRSYNEQYMFENWFPSAHLGLELGLCAKVLCGGASGGAGLRHAAYAIAAGAIDVCLVAAVSKETQISTPDHLAFTAATFDRDFEAPHGVTITGVNGGMVTQRYMHDYGVSHEKIALAAVRNREHAAANPIARYREPRITVADVLNSRLIADPCRLLECAPRDDGAAAIVLAAGDRAADFRGRPIFIRGPGEYHDPASFISKDLSRLPGIGEAARRACARAGIKAFDLDLAEIYAPFAALDLIILEELGLCPRGAGGDFIAEGNTHLGGKVPINPSGGLTSRGHPPFASELYGIIEIVKQLRGEAGVRQVPGAELGLAMGAHSGDNGATVEILERRD